MSVDTHGRMDDRNEADRILGEDWMDPRHALLVKALEAHPTRGLIVHLQQETDEHGERRWSLCRQVEEDGWVEVWLRPWPTRERLGSALLAGRAFPASGREALVDDPTRSRPPQTRQGDGRLSPRAVPVASR